MSQKTKTQSPMKKRFPLCQLRVQINVRSVTDRNLLSTNNIYNVSHYLNYTILARSLLSDIEIFSSLFMLNKHLVGPDIFFSLHAHMHIFTQGSMFSNTFMGKTFCVCVCVCFLIIWEFHSCRFYVQSTWLAYCKKKKQEFSNFAKNAIYIYILAQGKLVQEVKSVWVK